MRNILTAVCGLAAIILMSATAASCSKDTTPMPQLALQEETYQVFDLSLRFDAPEDVQEATVMFFDEHGQQVAVDNVSIPETSAEAVTTTFLSESRPAYIYTDGLQNTGDNGLLSIPASSVRTKAGDDGILLVIRH